LNATGIQASPVAMMDENELEWKLIIRKLDKGPMTSVKQLFLCLFGNALFANARHFQVGTLNNLNMSLCVIYGAQMDKRLYNESQKIYGRPRHNTYSCVLDSCQFCLSLPTYQVLSVSSCHILKNVYPYHIFNPVLKKNALVPNHVEVKLALPNHGNWACWNIKMDRSKIILQTLKKRPIICGRMSVTASYLSRGS
jgi:hypothetical protein